VASPLLKAFLQPDTRGKWLKRHKSTPKAGCYQYTLKSAMVGRKLVVLTDFVFQNKYTVTTILPPISTILSGKLMAQS
jgi:hypothetical protein